MSRLCPQGHAIEGDNAQSYRKVKNGKEYHYFKCRTCNQIQSKNANRKFAEQKHMGICPQCHQEKNIGRHKVCPACRGFNSKVSRGLVRPPDYAETSTDTYKEPMQKVEDGFGYYGAITQTRDGEHVQCHICGYFFRNLGVHVRNKHKVPVRDYRMTYGLRLQESLLSPKQKILAQENYNKHARKSPEEFKAMSVKAQAAIKAKGYHAGGPTWTAQTRNERGNCREQTLAKIKSMAERNDGILIVNDFMEEYGYGQTSVVNYWFGNWQNAIKEAGVKDYLDRRQMQMKLRRDTAIAAMQRFFDENGRTPQSADFEAVDYLSSYKSVGKMFGSLNNARQAAGIPRLVWQRRKWVEVD